jgi:hypothetical protein
LTVLYWYFEPTGAVSSALFNLRTACSKAVSLVSPSPWNERPVLVDSPLVWFSRFRTVISADAFSSATRNQGK